MFRLPVLSYTALLSQIWLQAIRQSPCTLLLNNTIKMAIFLLPLILRILSIMLQSGITRPTTKPYQLMTPILTHTTHFLSTWKNLWMRSTVWFATSLSTGHTFRLTFNSTKEGKRNMDRCRKEVHLKPRWKMMLVPNNKILEWDHLLFVIKIRYKISMTCIINPRGIRLALTQKETFFQGLTKEIPVSTPFPDKFRILIQESSMHQEILQD